MIVYVLQDTDWKSPALLTGQHTKAKININNQTYTNTNQLTSSFDQFILLYNNHITYEIAPA